MKTMTLMMACTALVAAALANPQPVHAAGATARPALVIGHRGASGSLPEHTLAAYWMAIEQGADYVEPDLVITKDGVLVARHENAIAIVNAAGAVIEATTDVADRPEFAGRKTTKTIDGVAITGWFTEDFTLAELKTLRARERLPALRVANTRFDGMFQVPTFEEVLQLVEQANARRRADVARGQGQGQARGVRVAPIGVYPETKHPSYFQGLGLALEAPLVRLLDRYGYKHADSAVFVQSFETANLRQLRRMTRVPIVQLFGGGRPYDFVLAGDPRGYADLATPAGLAEIAAYANGIGPSTGYILPLAGGVPAAPTTLIQDAHNAGLLVHAYTFRAENNFLPTPFDSSADAAALGRLDGWIGEFLKLGLDGFFTDHPFLGRQAVDAFLAKP